jgi:hypothetical protein
MKMSDCLSGTGPSMAESPLMPPMLWNRARSVSGDASPKRSAISTQRGAGPSMRRKTLVPSEKNRLSLASTIERMRVPVAVPGSGTDAQLILPGREGS